MLGGVSHAIFPPAHFLQKLGILLLFQLLVVLEVGHLLILILHMPEKSQHSWVKFNHCKVVCDHNGSAKYRPVLIWVQGELGLQNILFIQTHKGMEHLLHARDQKGTGAAVVNKTGIVSTLLMELGVQ